MHLRIEIYLWRIRPAFPRACAGLGARGRGPGRIAGGAARKGAPGFGGEEFALRVICSRIVIEAKAENSILLIRQHCRLPIVMTYTI